MKGAHDFTAVQVWQQPHFVRLLPDADLVPVPQPPPQALPDPKPKSFCR